MTFGDRLTRAMEDRGRFCAGIDPHPALLDAWGLTDSVNGLEKFAMTAVEAARGHGRGGQAAVGVLRAVRLARRSRCSRRSSRAAASAAAWCCST